ncbi:Protein FAM185A [Sciurus carolinensis]|uniref:Protein FAM185A n=1 Tax=Sciurus carolinensis TaxID=30640 RepID=A0AA41T7T0_SCICA|nr:Protein FAM185A [Sciurus carolinensis]
MFAPSSGWGLGCLRLGQRRVWAGAGIWTLRACQARRYGSAGGERRPGSEPEASLPGPVRRTLKEWTFLVSPFGQLRVRLPCHLSVRPLDPLTYPDGDRMLVEVCGVEGGTLDLNDLQVKYDEALQEMAILSDTIDPQASVEVNTPLKTVTIDKLQGNSVNISTEDGLLNAKYLYTESSFLSSAAGDIALGSVHDSSSGCLRASAHQGAIDVYVSQLGKVELKSHKGSVIVKVPYSLQAHLQLSGKEVDVNPEICVQEMAEAHKDDGIIITGLMNQASKHEKCINVAAPKGTVSLRSQSWFQSLKLQD